ncbi:MAG: protein kinase, partial [Chloroflexaceae bacterium]|nr:protein kinase [Chloroflexaceae bacterium]
VAYASGLPLGMKLHTTLSMDEVAWLVRPSLPDLPPTPCPNCQHPTPLTKWSCACCGLLFPSRVPAAVQELSGYRVLRPLGRGGMSNVYLVYEHLLARLGVIKTLAAMDENEHDEQWRIEAAQCLAREGELLQQLDHPNIVHVYDRISNHRGNFLILEYIPGPTLEERLSRLSSSGVVVQGMPYPRYEALLYGRTVATILEYFARLPQPIIHNDIKPANLIRHASDGRLVLVDFGSAVQAPTDPAATTRLDAYGTPAMPRPNSIRANRRPRAISMHWGPRFTTC